MLCIDNLIRLYFCYNGSFTDIDKSTFGEEVMEQFRDSNFTDLDNYLYSILGYKNSQLLEASKVAKLREEFCKKSYNNDYIQRLLKEYNVYTISELIDILDSKGILGIQKRQLTVLGPYKKLGIPSKFLNRYVCNALYIVENYLDNSFINGVIDCKTIKSRLVVSPDVKEVLSSNNLNGDDFFKVKFRDVDKLELKDGVLYMKDTGYSEELTRDYMLYFYLLGMPTIPLYLRDKFVSLLPKCITFGKLDELILDLLDFSYVADCTVLRLLEVFGFSLPNPEDMWRDYRGFFFIDTNGKICFNNKSSEVYLDLSADEFIDLVNSNEIYDLDIEEVLYKRDLNRLSQSNIFK